MSALVRGFGLYNALGIPALLDGLFEIPDPSEQTEDGAVGLPSAQKLDWGIYPSGGSAKVLEPDSIVALDYRREWALPGYPVEEGSFEVYNKVARPFEVRLRMAKGGSVADRKAFREALEKVCASLDLYDIVTPDAVYLSVNVTHLGLAQSAQSGVTLLSFDIGLQQIRTTPENATSSTASQVASSPDLVTSPTAAPTVNVGTVRPQKTPAPVARAAGAALSGQAPESTVFADTVGPL